MGPDGAGEGERYLGSVEVTTDSQGQAIFDVPFTPPADKPIVTATATDPQGNTSEISAGRQATVQVPTQSLRLVPAQPLILSPTAGDGIVLQYPDAGPIDSSWNLNLSVAAGTLLFSTTAGPGRLGRWDRDAALSGDRSPALERGRWMA